MDTHRTTATVGKDGSIKLEGLPFAAGERVEVIVRGKQRDVDPDDLYPLRGTPLRYSDPLEPVASDDWEVTR